MKRSSLGIALLLAAGIVACTPPPPPTVTLEVTASQKDGAPISGVTVSINGESKGETKDDGKLNIPLAGPEPGSEFALKATLERPGVKFTPAEQQVVVKR